MNTTPNTTARAFNAKHYNLVGRIVNVIEISGRNGKFFSGYITFEDPSQKDTRFKANPKQMEQLQALLDSNQVGPNEQIEIWGFYGSDKSFQVKSFSKVKTKAELSELRKKKRGTGAGEITRTPFQGLSKISDKPQMSAREVPKENHVFEGLPF